MKNKGAVELGSKGGRTTLLKNGRKHFVKAAETRWAKAKKKKHV